MRQGWVSLSQQNVSNHSVGCGEWVQEKLAFFAGGGGVWGGEVGGKEEGLQKPS